MKLFNALFGQVMGLMFTLLIIVVALEATIGIEEIVGMFQTTRDALDMMRNAPDIHAQLDQIGV
jgi:NADH:ubiquinone oxidoreductase subunit K